MADWNSMGRITRFFLKNFYQQLQAENGKKIKQMLSNTLRLSFCYFKIIHILHPHYHPEIIGHILKNKQKNKCVCIHTINHNENEDENEKHIT